MTVTRIVPTWNESILITSRLRISVTVTSLPYALQLLTNASISVHTTLDASKQFYSNIPLSVDVDVEIAGLPPIIQQSLDMRVTLADSSISAFEPIVGREVGVYVTSGYADIGVSAPIPRVQRSSDMYITGTVDSSISALSSNVPASLWHMRPVATNTTIGYLTPTFGVGSSTVLLLHMDGTNGSTVFNDSSLNTFTVTTNGDTVISTAQSQFGGSSGFFDGNLDYLSIANSDLHDLTADFTIEAWVYVSSFTSARTIAAKWGATPARAWYFEITSATVITFYCGLNGGASSLLQKSPASALVANTWYHIAVCRQSGSVRFFVNGTQIGTTATGVNATNNATAPLYIGLNADGNTAPFSGYIDELRIIKGVARYTANFTVPTSPFSS
jgi:hypothetical protein